MLKKEKFGILISILVVSLMFLGGCRHNSPEKMADKIVNDLTSKLELNTAQQEQLQAIKKELLVKVAEMKKARQSMHEDVLTEMQKDVLDQAHLKQMFNERKAEMDSIADLVIARLAQFHSTLSPEQKKKLVECMKDKCMKNTDTCKRRCPFGS